MKEKSQLAAYQKEDLRQIAEQFNGMAWSPYDVKRQNERPVLRDAMKTITGGHVLSEETKAGLVGEWQNTGQNPDHLATLARVFSISHILDHMGAERIHATGNRQDKHILSNLTGYHPPPERPHRSRRGFPTYD